MKAAYLSLTPDQQSLLQRTADRVRAFAVAQKASIQPVQGTPLSLTVRVRVCGRECTELIGVGA
jgi:hypothetical protein